MTPQEIAQAAVTTFTPAVTAPGAPKRSSLTSAILTALRPYLEAAVTGSPPKLLRDKADRREKLWLVSLEFWTGEHGALDHLVAASEGREVHTDGAVHAYGGDTVRGLDAAAELIAEYAAACGAPADFAAEPMTRALAYLRPTISRQNGHATMRRTSACERWHLVADIFREDAFPTA